MANKGVHHEASFSEIKYYHIKTDFHFYWTNKDYGIEHWFYFSWSQYCLKTLQNLYLVKTFTLKLLKWMIKLPVITLLHTLPEWPVVLWFGSCICGFWVISGMVRALWRIKTIILQIGVELDRCGPILIVDVMVDFTRYNTQTHSTCQTPNSIY